VAVKKDVQSARRVSLAMRKDENTVARQRLWFGAAVLTKGEQVPATPADAIGCSGDDNGKTI
jgi:hypothetical protein